MRNILKRDRNPLSKGTSPYTFSTQNADDLTHMTGESFIIFYM